jgi:FRG domain
MKKEIKKISELINFVSKIGSQSENLLVFRGEKKDYGKTTLVPLVYRNGYIKNEDVIYRESQRYNDYEFGSDKSVFDKLSRIQHYTAPTRLIDVSEDLFSAIFFSINDKNIKNDKSNPIIYIFEIDRTKIKYYDSDAVSVIANLVKIPLENKSNEKSKKALISDIINYRNDIDEFNEQRSVKFLLYEIRDEKPQFSPEINPQHLTSVQFVLPKLTSNRVRSQKGAFLLFGLNPDNYKEPIKIFERDRLIKSNSYIQHPILRIHKAILKYSEVPTMKKELLSFGIKKSFIYPEIDRVSEYLKEKYKKMTK